mgnify:CR=1 FL=1
MQQPVWKRLLWLAIIWGGSVLALGLNLINVTRASAALPGTFPRTFR